jgi:hypothetical protein
VVPIAEKAYDATSSTSTATLEERSRTAPANDASVTGRKIKMKSNELTSIRVCLELVPAVLEKNDRS